MPLNPPRQEAGFICPFVVIDPTDLGAATVVAPELMLDDFLPIPDTEPLPFYPSVWKAVVYLPYAAHAPASGLSSPIRSSGR